MLTLIIFIINFLLLTNANKQQCEYKKCHLYPEDNGYDPNCKELNYGSHEYKGRADC